MRNVGFLTIGQAPRHDISEAIERALPESSAVRHAGALDGLGRTEIADRFAVASGRPTLITRLTSGDVVTLDEAAMQEALQESIDTLDSEGVDAIVLLCTGDFPSLRSQRALLIEPDVLVTSYVSAVLRGLPVGVIVPLPEQVPAARDKWQGVSPPPEFATASPYADDDAELLTAAKKLVEHGARALVLDCMGYADRHRKALREGGVAVPVLTSSGITGALTGPLLT
ncbi:AroM family protein [Streptomyces sp. NPDC001904]|uniref:AroM family protein n=1 Tax=Streptomyces sp. NPDC001904 TaxID=3154531 RepID=UPI00331E791F